MRPVDYTVYLVTDAASRYRGTIWDNVAASVAGGASVVQYRATEGSRREMYENARRLRDLLRGTGVPLIINDHVDLALAVDAEGVHVGQNDLPAEVVRRLVGPGRIVGLSITDFAQIAAVPPQTVDYLGVGPVFPTGSKADAAPALGLKELERAVRQTPLPVVAIGGIDLARAAGVFATGAAGVAVVSALSRADDPSAVARALRSARHAK